MGLEMPKDNGSRCLMRKTTMASLRPKCVSLLYLSIRTEGRRLPTQKFPHDNIYDLTTLKLWEMMEIAFIRPRNLIFDRYMFSQESRKRRNGRTILQFFERIGGNLRLRKSRRGNNQRHLHHEHVGQRH